MTAEPKENGCICQECADAGYECERIARKGDDICAPCASDDHWYGDDDDR